MSDSTTSLWYRMSFRAVMASRSGALIRVGPNTMPKFSLDMRFSFSWWITLDVETAERRREESWSLDVAVCWTWSYVHMNRAFLPLKMSHEVSQCLIVSWRQQLQGLVERLQTFFCVCDLCMVQRRRKKWTLIRGQHFLLQCVTTNTGLMITGKRSAWQLHVFIVAKDDQSPLHSLAASYIIKVKKCVETYLQPLWSVGRHHMWSRE